MYIFPEMIELGLLDGQEWPSKEHKTVAQNLALCNSQVTTKDHLIDICQAIIKIPNDRIRTITFAECRDEFQVPV